MLMVIGDNNDQYEKAMNTFITDKLLLLHFR